MVFEGGAFERGICLNVCAWGGAFDGISTLINKRHQRVLSFFRPYYPLILSLYHVRLHDVILI